MLPNRHWVFPGIVVTWLVLVSVHSASSSFNGLLPLDARTGQPVLDLSVAFEYSLASIAVEPLMSGALAVVGAPDYRTAAISFLVWSCILAFIISYWRAGVGDRRHSYLGRARTGFRAAILCFSIFGIYGVFVILVPLPDKALTVSDPQVLVADLHSHTILSPDGIATAPQNIAYHQQRGYGVAAFSEHFSIRWRTSAPSFDRHASGSVALLRGVELNISGFSDRKIWLVAIGIQPRPDFPFPFAESENLEVSVRKLIDFVHNEEGGAVFALSFRLRPGDVERLVKVGVDGFEIANFGHPRISDDVKNALLEAQFKHQVALLANSDWHGWGGFVRTWTLIKGVQVGGAREGQVIGALRQRDANRIVPIVSHMMGDPSILRGAFAPIVEIVRYSGEMTASKVISWWFWGGLLIGGYVLLRRFDLSPGRYFLAGVLILPGASLAVRGSQLLVLWYAGTPFDFPATIGVAGICVGFFAMTLAAAFLRGGR